MVSNTEMNPRPKSLNKMDLSMILNDPQETSGEYAPPKTPIKREREDFQDTENGPPIKRQHTQQMQPPKDTSQAKPPMAIYSMPGLFPNPVIEKASVPCRPPRSPLTVPVFPEDYYDEIAPVPQARRPTFRVPSPSPEPEVEEFTETRNSEVQVPIAGKVDRKTAIVYVFGPNEAIFPCRNCYQTGKKCRKDIGDNPCRVCKRAGIRCNMNLTGIRPLHLYKRPEESGSQAQLFKCSFCDEEVLGALNIRRHQTMVNCPSLKRMEQRVIEPTAMKFKKDEPEPIVEGAIKNIPQRTPLPSKKPSPRPS
jgi:hypothetical protein